jgi:hypothetical protein
VDAHEAIAELGEPLTRERQRLAVTVDADDPRLGAGSQEGLGVTAHAQGAVHQHSALALERGSEEVDDAVAQHGDVSVGGGATGVGHRSSSGSCGRWGWLWV